MATEPIHAMTDNWSQGGTTFTGIGMNVTDAASAPDSKLLDLKVGGESKMIVSKTGGLSLAEALPIAEGGTGARTAALARAALNAMQNLDAANAGGAEAANWNDFVSPGPIPRLMFTTTAGQNGPTLNRYFYGLVFVFGTAVTQIAIPYREADGGMYRRSRFEGAWSTWKAVTSAAEIGLGNVANKSEEQMVASGAIADALGGKAPTSHTHLAAQISDSGAIGRSVLMAASQAAARSAIGVFSPATFASSRGSQPVGASAEPLAFVDFVATAPSMFATGLMQMTAGGVIYGYCKLVFTNLANGGVFLNGAEMPTIITTDDFKTLTSTEVFTGLAVGTTYRAQVYGRTNQGFATASSSYIRVLNA